MSGNWRQTCFVLERAFHPKKVQQMRIGVPKEIKTHEYRVGLTPAAVRE